MKKRFLLFSLLFAASSFAAEHQRGLIIPKNWDMGKTFWSAKGLVRGDLPTTFDWRQKVTLSPIKDQGNCGSCWAFSATETFRDAMIAQSGGGGDGSEKYVLDCNKQNYGCQGGFFDAAQIFVSPGSVRESGYKAYNAKKETCGSATPFTKAADWRYVARDENSRPSVDEMKAAMMTYGPLSVGVAAGSSWNNYSGGIYTACSNKQLNHAVQIVGWGETYWIMRNSWGTGWGEKGFMRIAFKDASGQPCDGIGEAANFYVYSGSPEPTPTPGPTPEPTPGPTPPPGPCTLPTASTGYGAEMTAKAGKVYLMGKKSVSGVTYSWSAEPAFNNNAAPTTAQIRYQPVITKTLTVTAKNACGAASASTRVILPTSATIVH